MNPLYKTIALWGYVKELKERMDKLVREEAEDVIKILVFSEEYKSAKEELSIMLRDYSHLLTLEWSAQITKVLNEED